MSETCTNDPVEGEKPVQETENVVFPPFPEPTDADFEEDISQEERTYYKNKFPDLNTIKNARLHCSACDRHLGCSAKNENKMRTHPMLRTLVCHTCHTFYNSGEFDKGDDGSELYCRWCGQGGQVYCCSACPHVFCAKCIKRNLGTLKIKEIEDIDDWKCFKCNPKCLWDLRAICWAVLRYCDLKNRIMYKTEDPTLRLKYQEDCQKDYSDCCKSKVVKRKEKSEPRKKDDVNKKNANAVAAKLPPTIQVKKFASINAEQVNDKKTPPQKRPASPKNKQYLPKIVKNPITITRHLSPMNMQPPNKRMKVPITPPVPPIRFNNDRKILPVFNTYVRTPRPKAPIMPMMYNGYGNTNNAFNTNNDNINLSIESLTQGLDMSAVAAMAANSSMQDDDVVCTPDLPMEPLCEVTEDIPDDDVECITPAPVIAAKATPPPPLNPPPIVPRTINTLPDFTSDNIIQMTENDVTVNAATGGLKFRVDPQTLSANKMYRLPDGRIFAINVNPNMPGGYSATIVAVTDNTTIKPPQKTATYAAKLSAVSTQSSTPPPLKSISRNTSRNKKSKRNSTPKPTKSKRGVETRSRTCDLNVPVEWFRYNLIDAIDALEYSLSRLNQLKKDATTTYLRSRTVSEMRTVTRSLESLLNTSSTRFVEIKENLNKDLKQYISKKNSDNNTSDDDDVEILPDIENDDPIFIDENSVESTTNGGQEVDLTGVGSSEHDSSEKSIDKHDTLTDSILNENRRVTRKKSKEISYAEEDINDDDLIPTKSPTHKNNSETQDVAKENGDNDEKNLKEQLVKDLDNDNTAAEDNLNNVEDKSNVENHAENIPNDEEMLQEHNEQDDIDKTMDYIKDNTKDGKHEENVADIKENSGGDEENLLDDEKNKTDDKNIADNNENETEDMSIDNKTLDEDTTSKDVPSESGANEDGILEELLKDDNELNSSDATENKDSSEMSSENKDS